MQNNLIKKSVINTVKKNVFICALLFIVVFGAVTAGLIPPQLLRQIIDHNLVPGSSEGLFNLAVIYIIVIVFIGVFDFLKGAVLTILGQKISKEIRMGMIEKLEKINTMFFSSNPSGSVVSRFTNDVETVNTLFTGGIIGMAIDCLKIVGIVLSIFVFSSKLAMFTLLLLPIIYCITRAFQVRMLNAQIKNRILIGKVNNHIAESLKNIRMIKSFSKESYMENNYKDYLKDSFNTVEKVNFYDSVFSPLILLIRAAVIGVIVILSSKQLNSLGISIGMVAASIELISNLFAPIENLGTELQNIQSAVSGIRRVNEFYNEPEDECKKNELYIHDIIPDRAKVELRFNDVSFYYNEGTDILQNICLIISPLEKVTFTGRTGVGKTTLFKIMMGLLCPTEGSITVNGTDVYTIPNREKRKIFGYVDQSFHIIKGTVADQISLRDKNITKEQVENALDFVGMTETISTLEKGLATPVNGDNLFSQGQKQLLAIARAIVTDPPLLLLDEMTASLDSVTEEKIMNILQKAGGTHTILSISHRLSSINAGDTVVILEKGRIINAGSPEMMLRQDEWYRNHIALEKLRWD
ncbi:MAG: ABC transporter ATP-binding protein [Eubacteriales bacterium]